jgi:hypothetical protein
MQAIPKHLVPSGPLGVVSVDFMVGFPASIGGNTNALVITYGKIADEACRVDCIPTRTRSGADDIIIKKLKAAQVRLKQKVVELHTDGGLELNTKKLLDWCTSNGTKKTTSPAYSHHRNGTVERANRTVSNDGCTLLAAAGAHSSHWASAFTYSTTHRNRIGVRRGAQETADQQWLQTLKPLSIGHLQPWGCDAMVLVPHEVRQGVIPPKAKLMMFVGWNEDSKVNSGLASTHRHTSTSRTTLPVTPIPAAIIIGAVNSTMGT